MDILLRDWLRTSTTRFLVNTNLNEFERWLRRSTVAPGTREYGDHTGTITLHRPEPWPPPADGVAVLVMGGTRFNGLGTSVIDRVLRFEIQSYGDEYTLVRCDCSYPAVQPYVAALMTRARKKWAGFAIVPPVRASDEGEADADDKPDTSQAPDPVKRPTAAQRRASTLRERARSLRSDGLTRKEIAHELAVSISTVDNYLKT